MMHYIVATQDACWADEFNIFGIWIGTKENWDLLLDQAKQLRYPCEPYFGSNENMKYKNFDDWFRNIRIRNITDEKMLQAFMSLLNTPENELPVEIGLWTPPDPDIGYPEWRPDDENSM